MVTVNLANVKDILKQASSSAAVKAFVGPYLKSLVLDQLTNAEKHLALFKADVAAMTPDQLIDFLLKLVTPDPKPGPVIETPPPVEVVPPKVMNIHTWSKPGARVALKTSTSIAPGISSEFSRSATADQSGYVAFLNYPQVSQVVMVVELEGYNTFSEVKTVTPDCTISASLVPKVKPLPAPRSRLDTLRTIGSFQPKRSIVTRQWGELHAFFDPFLGSLDNRDDRQVVYDTKKGDGQWRVTLAVSYRYNEANQPYARIPGRDFSKNLPALRALIEECIAEGFVVDLRCAGDGQSIYRPDQGVYVYNDDDGWTYGHQWLMANIDRIHESLKDLDPYIIWGAGFDGVWNAGYPWAPDQVVNWWRKIRSLVGQAGYVSMEWGVGKIQLGDGFPTYARENGGNVDVWYLEFDCPLEQNYNNVWQILARMLGPAYRRPANQPNDEGNPASDLHPAYYLGEGTPRGEWVVIADEYDTYGLVRGLPFAVAEGHRQYLRNCGCELVG